MLTVSINGWLMLGGDNSVRLCKTLETVVDGVYSVRLCKTLETVVDGVYSARI